VRMSLTVALPDQAPTDVYVDLDEDTPVAALRAQLGRVAGFSGSGLYVAGALLDDAATVGSTPLREGVVVSFSPAATGFVPPTRGWLLTVVGGRDAGAFTDLPVGVHELGRLAPFALSDTSASRRHAVLRVDAGGATIADLGSANGTTLDGQPVPLEGTEGQPPLPVAPGALIGIGDTLLAITHAAAADAALEPGPAGVVEFNRPPRMLPSRRGVRVLMPLAPVGRPPRKFPVIGMIAPLLFGAVMYLLLHSVLYLLFALMSPVMLSSNFLSDRRTSSQAKKAEAADYATALAAAHEDLRTGLLAETERRRTEVPDAVALLLAATLPTRRLWERRRHDEDSLTLRVGTADQPSRLALFTGTAGAERDAEHRTVYAVPATLSLRDAGVVGLAGPGEDVRGLARWLVLQLGVLQAPRDLSITLLAPRAERSWEWIRWLPQARFGDVDGPVAGVGNDPETVTGRVNELAALLKARREAVRGQRLDRSHFPAHLIVLDGARALRSVPGLAPLLTDGPDHGIFAICLESAERLLPEECTASIVVSEADPARLVVKRSGFDPLPGVLGEQVSEAYAGTVARAIAAIRDVSHDEDESSLPDSARLLDVVGLEPPTVDAVRAHWQLGGKSTRMPLGVGAEGTFALDLRTDGPHGLIAGTTGSGKSELLQSIVASLAIANRPDAMNFVLIDYKGGSAFKDCVQLPHTVGMVTDLDAHLVERALVSLGAELRRREHQLAAHAVKDIEDYDDLARREPALPPMPRLLIVIDEFASMARELPEFVTGLVNVAQRGRSLGIHLLLATQRPSGVVSAEIRANTNLRISLRVTDAADSVDVLESADAARLPKSAPGRGFARLGAGALQPFQAGRVGGRRPGVKAVHTAPPLVAELGWGQLGYAAPAPPRVVVADDVELTDLSVLVGAIRSAAQAEGLAHQRTPWLPALPDDLQLTSIPSPAATDAALAPIVYGLEDLPARQEQQPATLDLHTDGHLLAVGAPRSGRSQLLRTIAVSAAQHASCADVHLFGIDCGNGALLPLADLPHCGAVVTRTQTERVSRLLGRLAGELERRQALLADSGFADISEQRRVAEPADRLPHLLLLLDRWEGFLATLGELDGGRLTDIILTILREGGSVGVHAVMTGDRSLASGRISSLTESKIAFRLADRGDYTMVGLNQRQLPDEIAAGRAFRSESAVELQVALLSADPSGQGQAAAIAQVAADTRARDADVPRERRPFRVDVLPARVSFEEAWDLRIDSPAVRSPMFALVGIGGDELTAFGADLASTPAFVLAGPNRSGRSSALLGMVQSLTRSGCLVAVFAPRPSPLRELAGADGVVEVVTDAAHPAESWTELLDSAGDRPLAVVIDDGETLRDTPGGECFRTILKGLAPGRALVLGGNADGLCAGLSGWQVEAKKGRQGLLLSPQNGADGELLGVRLPRSVVGGPISPGRGILHLGDGSPSLVAVPFH
jgi:S-DNA-T family DNA segregation ATPase FtsK/SpoIIIE